MMLRYTMLCYIILGCIILYYVRPTQLLSWLSGLSSWALGLDELVFAASGGHY